MGVEVDNERDAAELDNVVFMAGHRRISAATDMDADVEVDNECDNGDGRWRRRRS